ncbi:MAG: hypothetical protein HW396_273 [Candidatus Dadabacteria bacterium]|jgi:hypothetical protein|nr:hypothetical protein [Candidatus Dadabacteria bacterium]
MSLMTLTSGVVIALFTFNFNIRLVLMGLIRFRNFEKGGKSNETS